MSEQTCKRKPDYPFSELPEISTPPQKGFNGPVPDDEECFQLWDKYEMLDNVRAHSLLVAKIAAALAERAYSLGMEIDVPATRASGLLHDIAKTWCIRNGGSHALLGGAWTCQETGNFAIAQGVILHVHWPWALPEGKAICSLPIFVLYADKRARHDQCVSLDERFEDLLIRYGKTETARALIRKSYQQSQAIEAALMRQLKWDADESPFDCGRLV